MLTLLRTIRLTILDFISKERSDSFVFRYQLILAFSSLIFLSYILAQPFFGQEKIQYVAQPGSADSAEFVLGARAPRMVEARTNLEYIDKNKTKVLEEQALEGSPLIFIRDRNLLKQRMNDLRDSLKEFRKNKYKLAGKTKEESEPILKAIRSAEALKSLRNLQDNELRRLQKPKTMKQIRAAAPQFLRVLFNEYVIVKPVIDLLEKDIYGNTMLVTENDSASDDPAPVAGKKIYTIDEVFQTKPFQTISATLKQSVKKLSAADFRLARKIVLDMVYTAPMARYSATLTEAEKERRLENVKPVKIPVNAGEVIILQGAIVTEGHLWQFEAYNKTLSNTNVASILSIFLLQAIFFFVLLLIFRSLGYGQLNSVSTNTIVFSLLWFMALSTFAVSYAYYNAEGVMYNGKLIIPEEVFALGLFLPIPVLSIILSIIFGESIAFVIGIYLSFFAFVAGKFDEVTFLLVFPTSMLVAFTSAKISKRIHFFRAGLQIFLIQTVILVAAALSDQIEYLSLNIAMNGVLALVWSFMAFGLLTLYEFVFNVPTAFRLLELADRDNPLLQRIANLAPSTYQHTMVVAGLSERAVRALGGNSLLTRVGAYYHDIGKTLNAGFYIENQHLIPKPEYAETMTPKQAAHKIIDHVLDGIEMAKQAHLPKEIIDFIPQHHGTSTMAYFYHKALAEKKSRGEIDRADFRYPGPKPQSREAGVMMLADSLEAAARSLDEPSTDELRELIDKIIKIKTDENQLDESGLTFGDLEVIRKSFLDGMMSMIHSRPKYPSQRAISNLEKKDSAKNGAGQENPVPATKKKRPAKKSAPKGGASKKTRKAVDKSRASSSTEKKGARSKTKKQASSGSGTGN